MDTRDLELASDDELVDELSSRHTAMACIVFRTNSPRPGDQVTNRWCNGDAYRLLGLCTDLMLTVRDGMKALADPKQPGEEV